MKNLIYTYKSLPNHLSIPSQKIQTTHNKFSSLYHRSTQTNFPEPTSLIHTSFQPSVITVAHNFNLRTYFSMDEYLRYSNSSNIFKILIIRVKRTNFVPLANYLCNAPCQFDPQPKEYNQYLKD